MAGDNEGRYVLHPKVSRPQRETANRSPPGLRPSAGECKVSDDYFQSGGQDVRRGGTRRVPFGAPNYRFEEYGL
jgi:hypothetical protein